MSDERIFNVCLGSVAVIAIAIALWLGVQQQRARERTIAKIEALGKEVEMLRAGAAKPCPESIRLEDLYPPDKDGVIRIPNVWWIIPPSEAFLKELKKERK